MGTTKRVGLIVPSSNVTMETELPRILARSGHGDEVTFHSSRAVLIKVDESGLDQMVRESDRCASEIADARVDTIAYACLIALMVRGPGAHEEAEKRIADIAAESGLPDVPVVSSAGALTRYLVHNGLERVAVMTPYAPELTGLVCNYLEATDIEVVDSVSLNVTDNYEVGRLDPARLVEHAASLDLSRAQALIGSACVQMPSLPALGDLEARYGLPVVSAATATASELMQSLGWKAEVPSRV